MAHMYPKQVPNGYEKDRGHVAECRVFEALRDTLEDDYWVFGWAPWILKSPKDKALDAEADFVVAHPGKGFVVLEVKGGRISHDAGSGKWYSTNTEGATFEIKDPFKQASDNKYSLRKKLKELPGLGGTKIEAGHGVVFPSIRRPAEPLMGNAPDEIVAFNDDLQGMNLKVRDMFEYWAKRNGVLMHLGDEGIGALRRVIGRDLDLPMPLGVVIDENMRQIIHLTEGQAEALESLMRNRRVLVSGGSGTGKTMLALMKAQRLAYEGFRTLLVCFNRPLAEFLQSSSGVRENLTINNFHRLSFFLAKSANLDITELSNASRDPQGFKRAAAEKLVEALGILGIAYDAIVVDEGQDFGKLERGAIVKALADPDDSVLYVFQDTAQTIYADGGGWPAEGFLTYDLLKNVRNTQSIHALLSRMSGDTKTKSAGPAGPSPELIEVPNKEEGLRELERALRRLVCEQNVPPHAIALLATDKQDVGRVVASGFFGGVPVCGGSALAPEAAVVDSVARFKGLERDVVVLFALEERDHLDFVRQVYVGAGRARSHLIVIDRPEVLKHFPVQA